MNIRILTQADAAMYRTLRLQALRTDPEAFGATYEDFIAKSLTEIAERLQAKGSPPERFTLGAFDKEGLLIGTMTLQREIYPKIRHKAIITGMYVATAARGQGVSKALMKQAIKHALDLPGLEQLLLNVVINNIAARNLYLSLGFEVYGLERQALKVENTYWDEELMVLYLRRSQTMSH